MNIAGNRIEIWPDPVPGYTGNSESERLGLIVPTNARMDRGVFEAVDASLPWSIETAIPTGLSGTVLAKINSSIITDPAQWSWSTVTFTGVGSDVLEWLIVFYETLNSEQIAYLSKQGD